MVMRQLDLIEPELPLDGGSFRPPPRPAVPPPPPPPKPRMPAPADFTLEP